MTKHLSLRTHDNTFIIVAVYVYVSGKFLVIFLLIIRNLSCDISNFSASWVNSKYVIWFWDLIEFSNFWHYVKTANFLSFADKRLLTLEQCKKYFQYYLYFINITVEVVNVKKLFSAIKILYFKLNKVCVWHWHVCQHGYGDRIISSFGMKIVINGHITPRKIHFKDHRW